MRDSEITPGKAVRIVEKSERDMEQLRKAAEQGVANVSKKLGIWPIGLIEGLRLMRVPPDITARIVIALGNDEWDVLEYMSYLVHLGQTINEKTTVAKYLKSHGPK